ncbi:Arfgef2 [Symbiodinium natans]|uniref:Arfgef2 protein n=2 Tax=Symbiodinium TaxID=2949 RepID=A0A812UD82_9DINO|nr:Arfgef2 [Symbiodinium natans]
MMQTSQSFEARGPENRVVDVVLRDALEKLRNTAPKKLKELRDSVEAGLKTLENLPSSGAGVSANDFFQPFKLGCEAAGLPKLVVIALEAIQKQITYGFLTGKGPDPFKPESGRHLIDAVVDSVCNCAESADDTVQMHMISTLLAAVTSQVCEVHGQSLMLAVDTCMKLYRDSKSQSNQRMAQTALTQMLSVITQRLELSSADMSSRAEEVLGGSRQHGAATSEQLAAVVASAPAAFANANADLAQMPKGQLLNEWMSSYLSAKIDTLVWNHEKENGQKSEVPPGKFGWCVVCRKTANHYCVDTRDSVCGHACKYRNLERLSLVEKYYGAKREEAASSPAASPSVSSTPAIASQSSRDTFANREEASSAIADVANAKSMNIYHQDSVIILTYLINSSAKDSVQSQADSRAIRNKRIALELILGVLSNAGPVFRSSKHFVEILKKLVGDSLIKNSVSPIPKIFGLSLQIFASLVTNFKEHLRDEIGVFIEQIFLKILESGNSDFLHKNRVLQIFYKLCTDATTPLELFLNYDCDVDEKNIFERTIDCLSKIAQGKYTAVEHANLIQPHQEQELKQLALQSLVTLMGSIVDWARRMAEDQKVPVLGQGNEDAKAKDGPESDGEDDASDAAVSLTTSTGASSAVPLSSFQEQKQRKVDLQIGINKFNMKPKRGIEYLKQNGFLNDDPASLAALFKNTELGLDKTAIGDYLGEDKPFNKNALFALVDGLDFKAQSLDGSLRHFLSYFRLPGEAQKIDRMMEKFAEKYCNDNPERFANADCAFVLSFSLIMLQTDLHNPGIKNKMTKDEFVKNNRGINDHQDLPREYLEGLYDGVLHTPISLQEDQEARNRQESQAARDSNQKYELFVKETESMVQKTKAAMQTRRKSSAYVVAQSVEHVKPLFEVACWPYLATLAVLLEMQDTPQSIELCIEGFKHCIRIAARFDMDTERDAFVSSLAKFTYLTTIKEMKQKNIECIKALLSIGLSEGNNLGPSWLYVLHCISQLERLQLIGTRGARQDFQFFQLEEDALSPGSASRTNASIAGQQVVKRRAHGLGVSALVAIGQDDRNVELVNSESIASQIDASQIELLFNRSTQLTPPAVVHFVTQLAKVSKEELALADQPRIFSLQKLVEVADFNMGRMRVVWGRIWRVLSSHFVEVAAHQNVRVCHYAMDSLRQLTMKFLEKDELAGYNFQADFLKPFETIMVGPPPVSKDVKDYLVHIIAYMADASFHSIRSGWKAVLHICAAAAQDPSLGEATVEVAFKVVEKVNADGSYHVFLENFTDGIRALLSFAQCKVQDRKPKEADEKRAATKEVKEDISVLAIRYLLKAAEYLADPQTKDLPSGTSLPQEAQSMTEGHPAAAWFPILRGLSMLVGDPRREVRQLALNGVFDILREHGKQVFDEDSWRMVFNGVIKPLFDDIHHQLAPASDQKGRRDGNQSWSSMGPPTCLAALTQLVRLIEAHLDVLAFLLEDVLRLIQNCIQHEFEAVARIGVEGFKQLLISTGKSLTPPLWQKVTNCILELFKESMPTKLMEVDKASVELPFNEEDVVIQCVVQLLLSDMLQNAVFSHYENIPESGLMTLLDALQQSFEFAQEFNRQIELRQALKRLGFMKDMKQLPGLFKQERESLSCSLRILFQVQADPRMQGTDFASQAVERLLRLCRSVLQNYVSKEKVLHERDASDAGAVPEAAIVEMEREVLGLVPIISEVVVKGLKDLPQKLFEQHIQELFPLFCDLTMVNAREVRLLVREVLVERVTPLLGTPS